MLGIILRLLGRNKSLKILTILSLTLLFWVWALKSFYLNYSINTK